LLLDRERKLLMRDGGFLWEAGDFLSFAIRRSHYTKFGTFLAGAGLALTLSVLPPAVFAQAPAGDTSSPMTSPNAVGENNPNAAAGASNPTSNEVAPQDKAQQVKSDLDAARQHGQNVSTARHQYRPGIVQ
jgi:hypothetical protein